MSEQDDILETEGTPEPKGPAWQKAHVILMALAGAALLIWLATGFYKVGVGEVALVERLGQYVRSSDGHAVQMEPGQHFGMPWPIERVQYVSVQKIQTIEATTFNPQPSDYAMTRRQMAEQGIPTSWVAAVMDPYLITADINVVHMSLSVQYRIIDPESYLASVAESKGHAAGRREELLRQMVEHQMIEVVSRLNVDDVLATQTGQEEANGNEAERGVLRAPREINDAIRKMFNSAFGKRFGIQVDLVQVTQTRPPEWVRPAFNEVTRARAEKSTATENAKAEKARMIAEANAERNKMVKNAEAYFQQVVNKATGEASQFQQLYERYHNNKEVTKYDLYQSMLLEVTQGAKRIYFVEEGQTVYITIQPPEGVINAEGGGMRPVLPPGAPPR